MFIIYENVSFQCILKFFKIKYMQMNEAEMLEYEMEQRAQQGGGSFLDNAPIILNQFSRTPSYTIMQTTMNYQMIPRVETTTGTACKFIYKIYLCIYLSRECLLIRGQKPL